MFTSNKQNLSEIPLNQNSKTTGAQVNALLQCVNGDDAEINEGFKKLAPALGVSEEDQKKLATIDKYALALRKLCTTLATQDDFPEEDDRIPIGGSAGEALPPLEKKSVEQTGVSEYGSYWGV